MNMFEYATRNKLRFETPRQDITTEDLWDLPMTSEKPNGISLDAVARCIAVNLTEQEKLQSFVSSNGNEAIVERLKISLEIVKHVINVRKEQANAKRVAADKERQRKRIKELIMQKEDDNLSSKSIEELAELLNEL